MIAGVTGDAPVGHLPFYPSRSPDDRRGRRIVTRPLMAANRFRTRSPRRNADERCGRRRSRTRLLDLALALAEAMAAAHERGVTHGDLKPSNVMIGRGSQLKVLDFGLARLRSSETDHGPEESTLTLTDGETAAGTRAYMSPEQHEGRLMDHRSDVFALGIILFEMATGRRPFSGGSAADLVSSVLRDTPSLLTAIDPAMPRQIAYIARQCMQKDPGRRYQTATDLRNALEGVRAEVMTGAPFDGTHEASATPSIAVLPFRDLSPDGDQAYFCDGVVEELVDALAKLSGLRVVSRSSARQHGEATGDVREVGRRLGVRTVLEGSVRKAGHRVRITAQLVDVTGGYHLWSDKYDRDLDDIFAVQDEISMAIVDKLEVRLLGGEKQRLVKRHTHNQEAHNYYLKGRYFWNRRHEGGLKRSLDYFQQAIEEDREYALPYVGVADAYGILGFFEFVPADVAFSRDAAAVGRALERDGSLGEVYASRAWIRFCHEWTWKSAERDFQKAIGLSPDYASAYEWYAVFLSAMNRQDEAIRAAQRARELDPLSLIVNAVVGAVYMFARQYERAVVEFGSTLEMDPGFNLAKVWSGVSLYLSGQHARARATLREVNELEVDNPYALGFLGWGLGASGEERAALAVLRKLDALGEGRYVSAYQRGHVLAGLGRTEEAFDCFEAAYRARSPLLTLTNAFPQWDGLRSDPRYRSLARRIGFEG